MPYYEYETIPQKDGEIPERFELRQCMDDAPLTEHPETGAPIKRVYSAFNVGGSSGGGHAPHSHGSGCGCCCGGHGTCEH